MDPYLVSIIVRDTANFTGHQLAEAAARGVFGLLTSKAMEDEVYDEWVTSGMRKITKRLKPKDFARYVASAPRGYHERYGELDLFVTAPYQRSEESPLLKRAQVSGFTTIPTSVFEVDHYTENFITIVLNASLGMSVGKAAAAAGHIAQLALEKFVTTDSSITSMVWAAWATSGYQFIVTAEELSAEAISQAFVSVQDAGHTEVEPGSTTALARWTS